MLYVLLNVNEFSYLIFSGALRVFMKRCRYISSEFDQVEIFRSAGYVKYSSPEAYMLCGFDSTNIHVLHSDYGLNDILVEMSDVKEMIPITTQAEVLLRPIIQRAQLHVSAPRFEAAWQRFVEDEILRERQEAAIKFAGLFDCTLLKRANWRAADGLYRFILKDLGSGLNEIERRSESAELGTFEFCVRLANEHDLEWKKSDPWYINLKNVRVNELSDQSLKTKSFLNFPKICVAIQKFEEESREKFGYSPFSLIPFFEFYRTHSRANGINFTQVRMTIESLLTFNRADDASDYVHLVGYALGLEEVLPATYVVKKDRFPIFNETSSYPKSEELRVNPPTEFRDLFALPEQQLAIDVNLAQELDSERDYLLVSEVYPEAESELPKTYPDSGAFMGSDAPSQSNLLDETQTKKPAGTNAVSPLDHGSEGLFLPHSFLADKFQSSDHLAEYSVEAEPAKCSVAHGPESYDHKERESLEIAEAGKARLDDDSTKRPLEGVKDLSGHHSLADQSGSAVGTNPGQVSRARKRNNKRSN
jgi:hypothetical protein